MSESRIHLGNFGDLLRMVFAAEDFGLTRAEACAVTEVISETGERVAVVVSNSGFGRGSNVRTMGRYYAVCTVRDGQIVSGREYDTREGAVEAFELLVRNDSGVS